MRLLHRKLHSVASLVGASGSSSPSKSRGLSRLSRGFGWLVSPSPMAARSRPAVRYFLDFPQSSPSLSAARSTASPTPEYSTTVFQVHRGGSNPLFPLFPSCPDAGGPSSLSPSVYLTDPSLAGTPRSGTSYGSFLACLHHESHRERKAFLTALTRLLAMIGSLPHRSHANRQLSVPFTLQQTVYLPYLLSAGAAHLTLHALGGLRRSPHLLPILYTSV